MKIDISKASYEGKEFTFGEAELTIRPYPQSRQDIAMKDGAIIIAGDKGQERFDYCLTGWKNVKGADDQPLPCTSEIKKKIYDFRLGVIRDEEGKELCMADFVLRKTNDMAGEIAESTKN